MIETLNQLFEDTVKDAYNAEQQFLGGMQRFAAEAENEELREALRNHIGDTEDQIQRLSRIADILDTTPTGKVCKAAQGLLAECEELIRDQPRGCVKDAAIIFCCQKNEHYEACTYGTLLAWAKQLGFDHIVPFIEETLTEEKEADRTLNQLAMEVVNQEAISLTGRGNKARLL